MQVTNVSRAGCLITSWPDVSYVDASGNTVGLPVMEIRGPSPPAEYELHPGQTATANLWEPEVVAALANRMRCAPTTMAGVRITWPVRAVVAGSQGGWPAATQVCTVGQLRPGILPFEVGP